MMNKESFFLSTIDPEAHILALETGLGLEIAEYCTAYRMDADFAQTDADVCEKLHGISRRILHAPFNELFPCAIDPKARRLAALRYRQAIDLAQRYHAHKIVIHGGYNPWIYYPVWYTPQSVLFWKDFMKEVPDGVEICLENVLEEEYPMLAQIVAQVEDPRLKLCLDIGHVNAYSRNSVLEWLRECADMISHFHIHNNNGDMDSHQGLADGTIPMQDFLMKAAVLCPDATYTLEIVQARESVEWLMENLLGRK